jgi:hypothetical protein
MKKKKKRMVEKCRWLRDHSSTMKPQKDLRFTVGEGEYAKVFWRLTNGQVVNEYNLRRMGL